MLTSYRYRSKKINEEKNHLQGELKMITKGIEVVPYRAALYGPPGIGKSTTANSADKPIFFNFEDALHHIDCYKTNHIKTFDNFKYLLGQVTYGEYKGQFKTIVIDTIDALEDLLAKELCKEHGRPSLGSFGFGQGYDLLNKKWGDILDMLDYASREYKMNVILIGHDQIRRYEDPMGDGYDRITLKMHHKSALTLISRMDAVLYMTWEKMVRKTETKTNKAIGTGKRIIHTIENPAFLAKNRYDLKDRFEVDQNFFAHFEMKIYFEPKVEPDHIPEEIEESK